MQKAIDKASALVEAHPYIRRFRGRRVVIKLGGSIMDDPGAMSQLLADVSFMHGVGMRPILVHGGGKAISAAMAEAGLEPHFVQGRRYTDERTLAIAEHVLCGQINRQIVDELTALGAPAMGLHSLSSCALFARQLYLTSPDDPKRSRIDVGLVGEVTSVNAGLVIALCEAGFVPVIAPIAMDAAGHKLNVNADSAAGCVAAAVKPLKLVLVSDTHGIRTSADGGDDSFAPTLTAAQIQSLIDEGVISSGMLPKVEAALAALEAGVEKAHIIDGRIAHSLLLEIYTDRGVGTEIILNPRSAAVAAEQPRGEGAI